MKNAVVFIVGPTASGKSSASLAFAKKHNAEIISADSMQIYQGMDIGTAKPTPAERAEIPHHLIDICSTAESFSVFEFRKAALAAITDICRRGRVPVVVGGSGLYIRSLLQGLSETAGADPSFRELVEKDIEAKGLPVFYFRLQETAPEVAKKIKPSDKKRIIRALEILRSADGATCRASHKNSLENLGYRAFVIGLVLERKELYAGIESRVDAMFEKGFYQEALSLSKNNLSLTASQALGYKELWAHIGQGGDQQDLAEIKSEIKRNTRRYAKRQMTWFRKEKNILWLTCDRNSPPEYTALRISEKLQSLGFDWRCFSSVERSL